MVQNYLELNTEDSEGEQVKYTFKADQKYYTLYKEQQKVMFSSNSCLSDDFDSICKVRGK